MKKKLMIFSVIITLLITGMLIFCSENIATTIISNSEKKFKKGTIETNFSTDNEEPLENAISEDNTMKIEVTKYLELSTSEEYFDDYFSYTQNEDCYLILKQNGKQVWQEPLRIRKENGKLVKEYNFDFKSWPIKDSNGTPYIYQVDEKIGTKYSSYMPDRYVYGMYCSAIESHNTTNGIKFSVRNYAYRRYQGMDPGPVQKQVYVEKRWEGEITPDTRPDRVEVDIKNTAFLSGQVLKFSGSSDKTSLFAYPSYATAYEYMFIKGEWIVEEKDVPGYEMSYEIKQIGNSEYKFFITNTFTNKRDINVTKVWNDEGNAGKRPTTIHVDLLRDGEIIDSKDINYYMNWKYTFEDLPFMEDGTVGSDYEYGHIFNYTLQERPVPGYITEYDNENFIITNTYKEGYKIEGKKTWEDSGYQSQRPSEITVHLYKDGEEIAQTTTDSSKQWKYSFTDLVYGDEETGQPYKYTIKEDPIEGYFPVYNGYNITNKINKKNITSFKTWKDTGHSEERPEKIVIELLRDGEKIDEIETSSAKSWKASFNNLPIGEDGFTNSGKEIGYEFKYTVREKPVEGYITKYTGYNITNEYNRKDISGIKIWNDAGYEEERPAEIVIELLRDGEKVDETATNAEKEWRYTFSNVPIKENGLIGSDKEIDYEFEYTVREKTLDRYVATYNGYEITNTHQVEKISIEGSKTWNDNNNQDGVRPNTITINLLANGEKVDSKQVTENEEWKWNFENLDKYKNGTEIIYTITEDEVEGYTSQVNGYNVTNTHTPGETVKTVQKIWEDNNNQDGIRPESIEVQLLSNGEVCGDKVTLSEENEWEYTWERLPEKKDGVKIEYTLEEIGEVPGYEVSYDNESFIITNTHNPEKIEVSGTKTWEDNNNQDGVRPNTITINLLANGEKVDSKQVTENEEWKWNFENLDKYKNGTEIVYTITEDEVDGYTAQVNGYNITNTHEVEKVSIEGNKTWNDNNNQDGVRPNTITINLLANGEKVDSKEITENEEWKWTFTDLPKYKEGTEIVYTITEDEVEGYTSQVNGYNITNTHEVEKISIEGSKTWEDNNNQDGVRPNTITINLLANGEKVDSKQVTEKEEWKWIFTDLPKYKEGTEIVYTITEDQIEGYTSQVNGYNVTNIHVADQTEVTVQKFWNDYNNFDGIRPQEIQVQLYANKNAYGEPVTLNFGMDWKYTWTNLPKKQYGEDVKYTVKELGRVVGYEVSYSEDTFTITNTHDPVKVSIQGQKTWEDNENQDGIRPQSITVNLYADDEKIASQVVTEKDNWSWRFDDLYKYDAGAVVDYYITEDTVEGYETRVNGFNITNIHEAEKISIEGNKTWEDNNNQDGVRPQSITINLFANGEKIDTKQVTENEEWKWNFENLPKYKNGVEIEYTISEENVENYTSKVEGYNIINTHTPGETGRTVQKVWQDSNNQDGIRPESIEVQLLSNGEVCGEKVTLSEENEWKYTWEKLPEKKEGVKVEYTLEEIGEVPGYEVTYDNESFIIINTHEPEKIEVSGSKTWNDNNNQDALRPDEITINLFADGEKIDTKQVTEKHEWKWTFTDLPKYKEGTEIVYTITEDEVEGYTSQVEGYNVINTHEPEKIEVSGTKTWEDNNNQDGIRPEKITINLLANGEKIDSKEITENEEWKWTFIDLPKYKEGTEIVYSITEDEVTGYMGKIDGYNVINIHEPEKTEVSGSKTWEDNNNQDKIRPEKITINLLANGEKILSKEVTEKEGWKWKFEELDKYKDGKEIKYTITEEKVEGYESKVEGYNVINTHKHVEEKPKPTEPEKPIKPAEPEKPTPPVTPPPVVNPPSIINNNYNNVTNNISTTNHGNTDSGKRLPDTGDILPIATIGTIITVALLNIVVTLRKKKRVGKHIK